MKGFAVVLRNCCGGRGFKSSYPVHYILRVKYAIKLSLFWGSCRTANVCHHVAGGDDSACDYDDGGSTTSSPVIVGRW
jgi:hypothetical protein